MTTSEKTLRFLCENNAAQAFMVETNRLHSAFDDDDTTIINSVVFDGSLKGFDYWNDLHNKYNKLWKIQ